MPVRRAPLAGRILWLALASLAMLATAPTVRAGCGDHLRSIDARFAIELTAGPIPVPISPPAPCAGPSCSRSTETPATAQPPPRILPDRCIRTEPVEVDAVAADQTIPLRRRIVHDDPARDRPERPPRR